jgi:hypothetical protein
MQTVVLTLNILTERFAICQLDSLSIIPDWATLAPFFSISRTVDGMSIVCPENYVPQEAKCERGWNAFKFEGSSNFNLNGIEATVINPLAKAGVKIFPISTYGTDYALVKETQFELAIAALLKTGYHIRISNLNPTL